NVLEAFKNILFIAHKDTDARNSLFNYLNAIVDDINEHVTNEYDRREVTNMLNSIARISQEQGEKLVARFEHHQK
ncbi:MAG: hypothetical protein ACI9W0_003285, partial [Gammaproteobacteria bacterium]